MSLQMQQLIRYRYLLFILWYYPVKMMHICRVASDFDLGIYFLNIHRQSNILYLHCHSVLCSV